MATVKGNIGVVGVTNGAIKCYTCSSTFCNHVKFVQGNSDNGCVLELKDHQRRGFRGRPGIVLSKQPIPIDIPDPLHSSFSKELGNINEKITIDGIEYMVLCDPLGCCPTCKCQLSLTDLGKPLPLIDEYSVHTYAGMYSFRSFVHFL